MFMATREPGWSPTAAGAAHPGYEAAWRSPGAARSLGCSDREEACTSWTSAAPEMY